MNQETIDWLLEGDISLQYLVHRDILGSNIRHIEQLQNQIPTAGWGKAYLSEHKETGHWGDGFYYPKWTNSHYTLLELKNIACPLTEEIKQTLDLLLPDYIAKDGGLGATKHDKKSDLCINGMFLNYACYYGIEESKLHSIIDFVIKQVMIDGGFNCQLNRSGAVHSSLHSSLSMLEGLEEYMKNGYGYRLDELKVLVKNVREFILEHHLYKSDKTGEIIHPKMTAFTYPNRWRYDVLRSLVYFAKAGVAYDERMKDALELLMSKQSKNGKWPLQAKHPGVSYFNYEKASKESRINTYRALLVLKAYGEYVIDM